MAIPTEINSTLESDDKVQHADNTRACLLEALPVELLITVMSNLSPADLLSTISASRVCRRVSFENERYILQQVVDRDIIVSNRYLAFRVCAVPQVPFACPPRCELKRARRGNRREMEEVLSMYRDGPMFHPGAPHTVWLHQIFKLCLATNHFMERFARSALAKLQSVLSEQLASSGTDGGTPSQAESMHHELSLTERTRLQRAFFLFEHWRRVWAAGLHLHQWKYGAMSEVFGRVFQDGLLSFSRRTLSSVWTFLRAEVMQIFQEVEDDLSTELGTLLNEMARSRKGRQAPSLRGDKTREPFCAFKGREEWSKVEGLKLLSVKARACRTQDAKSLTFLGLPTLRYLQKASKKSKEVLLRALVRRCPHNVPEPFRPLSAMAVGASWDLEGFVDQPEGPNAGCLWVANHQWKGFREHPDKSELSELGIAIWDKPRLDAMGLFRTSLTRLCLATLLPSRWETPSVEEAFGGVSIDKTVLQRFQIEKAEDGDVDDLLEYLDY